MASTRYNPEKSAWKGRSYKKGGERVQSLRHRFDEDRDRVLNQDFYIHFGDANHRPMQTIKKNTLKTALIEVKRAIKDGWPVRVEFGGSNVSGETFVEQWGKIK